MRRRSHDVDHWKLDETGYQAICVECGKQFESTRADAAFCSSTCRSREYRRRQNRQVVIDRAIESVKAMLAAMPRKGDSRELSACNEIIARISKAIHNVESKEDL